MSPPVQLEWGGLSYRSREIVSQITLRIAAGYSSDEIASIIEYERPTLGAATLSTLATGGPFAAPDVRTLDPDATMVLRSLFGVA